MKFGIIGTGMIAHFHAKAIEAMTGGELHSCFNRTPEKANAFAEEYGITAYSSLDDFLADPELQVVTIGSPSGTHQEPAIAALNAKKHVVCEKPLEVTIQEQPDKVDFQESAWIIQLMALKNAENAHNLVKDLQKRGYQAHVKPENGFTRVIIGPDVSKTKLEKQIIELEKITGSKGQLLKFKPINP